MSPNDPTDTGVKYDPCAIIVAESLSSVPQAVAVAVETSERESMDVKAVPENGQSVQVTPAVQD
jgi:hypothetical protein